MSANEAVKLYRDLCASGMTPDEAAVQVDAALAEEAARKPGSIERRIKALETHVAWLEREIEKLRGQVTPLVREAAAIEAAWGEVYGRGNGK
ncbi:MAG TPA: hypothetical protein PK406_00790 [Verrucomicrobiota bacterium]|nr:hypothetical protein [Verrucomicrobiota bacterium]